MATQKIFTREFILCFLAQFAFTSVIHLLTPTLPIYLSRLESSEVEIGILIGVLYVSSLVVRPFVGRALLRIPEKKIMMAGALLFVLTFISLPLAPPFWPILMVRIFQGIAVAFTYTASVTLIANITPETHRGQSISYFYLSFNIAMALAPAFGMVLVNHFGFLILFLVCTGLSLSSLLIANKLGSRQIHPVRDSSIEDGTFLTREALPPAIMSFFANIIWGTLAAFFPLYAVNQGVDNPGFFFTTIAIMLILGRTLGGRILDLYSRERVLLPCLITFIISMVILVFSKTLPLFIIVAVIWGIGHAFFYPSCLVYVLDRVGSSLGPAMGTFTAISDLGMFMGPVMMGIILRLTSYPTMFLCLALTGVINLNYFLFFVRKKS